MEAEKTRLLVSIEAQKVVQKQAETEKIKATIGKFDFRKNDIITAF